MALVQQTIEQLSAMYQLLGLVKDYEEFGTKIYFPMVESEPDPNDLEDQLENAECKVSNVDIMELSCAYVVGALRATGEGDQENAWVAVGHAQYWLGTAWGLGVLVGVQQVVFKKRSSLGGQARADKMYGDTKEEALRLALEHLNGTRANAARQIKQAVMDFHEKAHPHYPLSETKVVERISGWLTDLDFKGKRGPRKPNLKS